ncbi:MAG: hypothetical protein IJY20_02575 [Clostridia bacterium]|nr:hypothetical protein [Clostridia bacterium]
MKSVYSLMLDDGVVAAIDRLAYLQNTNRSGLVNQILAEYASYVTPEQRIREAFGRISALLDGQESFQLAMQPSDTMLSLRSALLYKYNPTVRYSVELFRSPDGEVGELRVSMRTQNSALTEYMMRFYRLWARVEETHIGRISWQAVEGKYSRRLVVRENRRADAAAVSPETLGELIAAYIRTFDRALKMFFQLLDDPAAAAQEIDEIYTRYLHASSLIV